MQCFTVFFSMRNVYYCANEDARSKNYNLRTAQKTITLLFSFSAYGGNLVSDRTSLLRTASPNPHSCFSC